MKINILSERQIKEIIKVEVEKVRISLFDELNKMRNKVLELKEENRILRRLLK